VSEPERQADVRGLPLGVGNRARLARVLGVTQPTVSRRLADLETTFGEPLFVRSVAGASPTPRLSVCSTRRRMSECYGELERVASGVDKTPRGVVTITRHPASPTTYWHRSLAIDASVRRVDLVRREADLALRTGRSVTRDLVTLASLEEPVRASTAYAAELPKRATVADVRWVAQLQPKARTPRARRAQRRSQDAPRSSPYRSRGARRDACSASARTAE
jgi:DNA-binding transcriptional LysR family regulator